MNIAIVDDEVIVQKRLQAALEKDGHSVKTYGTGEAFLLDLDPGNFDLVFLDVVLPGQSTAWKCCSRPKPGGPKSRSS